MTYGKFLCQLEKGLRRVTQGYQVLGLVAVVWVMLWTVVDVCGRYFFSKPLYGTNELTEIGMVCFVFAGIAYTTLIKGQVSIDLLFNRFSPSAQRITDVFDNLLVLAIVGIIAWRVFIWAGRAGTWTSGQLGVPWMPFAYIIFLGCILTGLVVLLDLLKGFTSQGEKR